MMRPKTERCRKTAVDFVGVVGGVVRGEGRIFKLSNFLLFLFTLST